MKKKKKKIIKDPNVKENNWEVEAMITFVKYNGRIQVAEDFQNTCHFY